jgi:hypothetical protein
MDMAHKYTLSRKIGQLPEEALPSVLKIVEQLSPKNLRQVSALSLPCFCTCYVVIRFVY